MSPENFRSQQQHDPPILRVQLAVFVKHGGIWETDGKRDGILVPVQPKLVICQGHHPLLVRRLHRQEAVVHDGFQVRYPCEMNEVADALLSSLRLDVGGDAKSMPQRPEWGLMVAHRRWMRAVANWPATPRA